MTATRYLVLRIHDTGRKALIAAPNDFATEAEDRARIAEIEGRQLQVHHTYLEIWPYTGDKYEALASSGILY